MLDGAAFQIGSVPDERPRDAKGWFAHCSYEVEVNVHERRCRSDRLRQYRGATEKIPRADPRDLLPEVFGSMVRVGGYSTVTLFAKLRGLSTLRLRALATW